MRKSKIKEKVENLPWNKKNPKKKSKKLTAAEKKRRKSVSDEDHFEL